MKIPFLISSVGSYLSQINEANDKDFQHEKIKLVSLGGHVLLCYLLTSHRFHIPTREANWRARMH